VRKTRATTTTTEPLSGITQSTATARRLATTMFATTNPGLRAGPVNAG
jgi:hypothetical protein